MYFNNSYMGRGGGGCASCSVNNYRNTYSPGINTRYTSLYNSNSNTGLYQDSYNSYNDRIQRIMTPPRNYALSNYRKEYDYSPIRDTNYQNYYSPGRNTGCRSCSLRQSNDFNGNNYPRPSTGNYLNRSNNLYSFNNNNSINNNNNSYLNSTGFNFRKNLQKDFYDNTFKQNDRYSSPLRAQERKNDLYNSYSFSSSKLNNNNKSNNNNYTNNNLLRSTMNSLNYGNNYRNNDYKTRIEDKYRNNLNDNSLNNYRNNYNYNSRIESNNYNSPSYKSSYINNRKDDNNYLNNRFDYLSSSNSGNNKFTTFNIYNYPRKLREMLQERKTFFIFIYGSHDYSGKSWCSDCNIAMPNVEQVKNLIKNNNSREVYFIDLPIDKINMTDLGDDPIIRLEKVPTLIYFENGMERSRLIENDLFPYQDVRDFVLQAFDSYNPRKNLVFYNHRKYY